MGESSADTPTAAPGPPLITCPDCGNTVPQGEYCGACGTHLVTATGGGARRHHAFAANPAEHVLLLSVISTLFPHLPHRRTTPFRIALLVAAALLLVLGLVRLTGPAVVAAALAVPLLYLTYLYEVEVYENEPYLIIGLTFVLGLLLGIPWALLTGPLVLQALEQNSLLQGVDLAASLVPGIIFPLVAQLLMLVGPLIIYLTRRYDEALDGFTFGVASALGFTLATTFVDLLPELQLGLVSDTPVVTNLLDVLERGLLTPFLNASTTGLLAGALWLRRGRTRALAAHGWSTSLVSAILIAALVRIFLGMVAIVAGNAIAYEFIAYVVVTIALLLIVRVSLHHMLLAEAVEVPIGAPLPCTHCHRIVPRMAFCPHCGVATRATPKTGAGRTGRAIR
jgi:RsiW-degrading membrane proteinase PrsW (M82 family)/RNA polymerase subunit RPABC4/transcription elongation factor Spt4